MEPSNGKRPLPGFLEISEAPAENRTKGMLRGVIVSFQEAMEKKLAMLRRLVAQPINGQDTCPSQARYQGCHCGIFPSLSHGTLRPRWARACSLETSVTCLGQSCASGISSFAPRDSGMLLLASAPEVTRRTCAHWSAWGCPSLDMSGVLLYSIVGCQMPRSLVP